MLKNNFKTAWSNLARNKIYSFINIAGLSIGLACTMLIMLYVKDEVSFDRFHKNVNDIYRIAKKSKHGQTGYTGFLQGPRRCKQMVAKFSLPRYTKLVALWSSCITGCFYCINYSKLSSN